MPFSIRRFRRFLVQCDATMTATGHDRRLTARITSRNGPRGRTSKLLNLPMSQLGVTLDGDIPVSSDPATLCRTRSQTASIPSPLLVVQRMVYSGWGAGNCRAVLSGPSAPHALLERKMMIDVEGGTVPEWFMRILRHEAGHVMQHSYQLRSVGSKWQQLFGRCSKRYPEFYRPEPPASRRHVQHLPLCCMRKAIRTKILPRPLRSG